MVLSYLAFEIVKGLGIARQEARASGAEPGYPALKATTMRRHELGVGRLDGLVLDRIVGEAKIIVARKVYWYYTTDLLLRRGKVVISIGIRSGVQLAEGALLSTSLQGGFHACFPPIAAIAVVVVVDVVMNHAGFHSTQQITLLWCISTILLLQYAFGEPNLQR